MKRGEDPGAVHQDKKSKISAGQVREARVRFSHGPQIILEEAGGIVTDLDGKPIDYKDVSVNLSRSFVASANSELHRKIIEELAKLKV